MWLSFDPLQLANILALCCETMRHRSLARQGIFDFSVPKSNEFPFLHGKSLCRTLFFCSPSAFSVSSVFLCLCVLMRTRPEMKVLAIELWI